MNGVSGANKGTCGWESIGVILSSFRSDVADE